MKRVGPVLCLLLMVAACSAPKVLITGTVYDEDNIPMKYCAVYRVPKEGVMTDSLGHYSIKVPVKRKAIIHFSSIGYKDLEIELTPVSADCRVDVQMEIDSTAVF